MKATATVLYDYNTTKLGQLPIKAGELLATGKQAPGGWILATNAAGQSGYVPEKYLRFEGETAPAASPAPTPSQTATTAPVAAATVAAATAAAATPALAATSSTSASSVSSSASAEILSAKPATSSPSTPPETHSAVVYTPAASPVAASPVAATPVTTTPVAATPVVATASTTSPRAASPPPAQTTATPVSPRTTQDDPTTSSSSLGLVPPPSLSTFSSPHRNVELATLAAVAQKPPATLSPLASPKSTTTTASAGWNPQLLDLMHKVQVSSAKLESYQHNLSKLISEGKVITGLLRDALKIPHLSNAERNAASTVAGSAPELLRSVQYVAQNTPDSAEKLQKSVKDLDQRLQAFFAAAVIPADYKYVHESPAANPTVTASAGSLPGVDKITPVSRSASVQIDSNKPRTKSPRPSSKKSSSSSSSSSSTRSDRKKKSKSSSSSSTNHGEALPPLPLYEAPIPEASSRPRSKSRPKSARHSASSSANTLPAVTTSTSASSLIVPADSKSSTTNESTTSTSSATSPTSSSPATSASSSTTPTTPSPTTSTPTPTSTSEEELKNLRESLAKLKAELESKDKALQTASREAEEAKSDVNELISRVEGLSAELLSFRSAASTYTESKDRREQEFELLEKELYHAPIEVDHSGRLTAAGSLLLQLELWHSFSNRDRADARLLARVRNSIKAITEKFRAFPRVVGHYLAFATSILDYLQSHAVFSSQLSGSSIRQHGMASVAAHEFKYSGVLEGVTPTAASGVQSIARIFEFNIEELTLDIFRTLLASYHKQLQQPAVRALTGEASLTSTILFRELDRIYTELVDNYLLPKVVEHLLLGLGYYLNAVWFNTIISAEHEGEQAEAGVKALCHPTVATRLQQLLSELGSWLNQHIANLDANLLARISRESSAAAGVILGAIEHAQGSSAAAGFEPLSQFPFLNKWHVHQLLGHSEVAAVAALGHLSSEDSDIAVALQIPEEISFYSVLTAEDFARVLAVPPHSLRIIDPYNKPRAFITPEGAVLDSQLYPLGFVREEGHNIFVSSFDQQALGSIDSGGIIANTAGTFIGSVQVLNTGVIKNDAGSLLAEVDTSGQIRGNANTLCGHIDNFSLHFTRHFSTFCLFFDEADLLTIGKA